MLFCAALKMHPILRHKISYMWEDPPLRTWGLVSAPLVNDMEREQASLHSGGPPAITLLQNDGACLQCPEFTQGDSCMLGTGMRGRCMGRKGERQTLWAPLGNRSEPAWKVFSARRDLSGRGMGSAADTQGAGLCPPSTPSPGALSVCGGQAEWS